MTVNIGVQLYSVRNAMSADPEGTLANLARRGITRVEGANHTALEDAGIGFGITADRLRHALDSSGMRLVGTHINPLDPARLGPVLDFHAMIGTPGIGCDIEFYPYGDIDYVRRRADVFTRIGQMCADRGMVFYYHNHFQEFQEFGGRTVYELVLENTDPDLVKIEMDTYWVYRGGHDPLEWIRRYGDRVILAHQKDFPVDFAEPLNLFDGIVDPREQIDLARFLQVKSPGSFAEIGTGTLPLQSIVDALASLPHFRCLLLEQDFSALDDLASIDLSLAGLSRLTGVTI